MSNPAAQAGRAETRWLSPQDWSLRVKLGVALLVPSLIAVVLGGLRVADQAGEAAEFDRVARYATAQDQVARLVKRIQDERLRSTEFVVAGRGGDQSALQAAFAAVDAEEAANRSAVAEIADIDATVLSAQRQAEQAMSRLPQLRSLVLSADDPAAAVVSRYSELIGQVLPLGSALLRGVNTPGASGLAGALSGLSETRNEATLEQSLITVAAASQDVRGLELAGLPASEARLTGGLDNFRTALDTAQRARFAGVIAGQANSDRARLATELIGLGPDQSLPAGTAVRATTVFGGFVTELDAAEGGIRAELAATGEAARSRAVNLAVLNVIVLLAALIIGALIVGLIARELLLSLRTLRSSALDIAQKRLPDAVQRMRGGTAPDVNVTPVPVHTREEVGEVARAFDAVHEQAVRLAAEQAILQNTVNSMFVNLSRRSQSLVDRQLQLIEELESNEQDPDQLASLFRLDHLATRMRRNSENLLVLAGNDPAKRSAHHVPVVDVLQAAVSEVEQYERVTVEQPPAVAILGRAANDLQHLLSELLDNATTFSPPETQVMMSARRDGSGSLVVEIVDRGIGMQPPRAGGDQQPVRRHRRQPDDRVPADGPVRGRPARRPARGAGAAGVRWHLRRRPVHGRPAAGHDGQEGQRDHRAGHRSGAPGGHRSGRQRAALRSGRGWPAPPGPPVRGEPPSWSRRSAPAAEPPAVVADEPPVGPAAAGRATPGGAPAGLRRGTGRRGRRRGSRGARAHHGRAGPDGVDCGDRAGRRRRAARGCPRFARRRPGASAGRGAAVGEPAEAEPAAVEQVSSGESVAADPVATTADNGRHRRRPAWRPRSCSGRPGARPTTMRPPGLRSSRRSPPAGSGPTVRYRSTGSPTWTEHRPRASQPADRPTRRRVRPPEAAPAASWPPIRSVPARDDFAPPPTTAGGRRSRPAGTPPIDTVPGTDLPRRTPGAQLLPGGITSRRNGPVRPGRRGDPLAAGELPARDPQWPHRTGSSRAGHRRRGRRQSREREPRGRWSRARRPRDRECRRQLPDRQRPGRGRRRRPRRCRRRQRRQ